MQESHAHGGVGVAGRMRHHDRLVHEYHGDGSSRMVKLLHGSRQHMFSQDAYEEGKRPIVGMEEKLESLEIIYDLQPAG